MIEQNEWKIVPREFHFLMPFAMSFQFPSIGNRVNIQHFLMELPPTDRELLADICHHLCSRQIAECFINWLRAPVKIVPTASSSGIRFRLGQLARIFDELKRKGDHDFQDWPMYNKISIVNWTNLPEPLHYLKEPADKYGEIKFANSVASFLQTYTLEQKAELQAVAERIVSQGDMPRIAEWTKRFRMADYPESAMVYFLIKLLHEMQLFSKNL